MQQQAGLAGCLGLLAQGGEPGQDAAIAAALGAPFGLAIGEKRMGAPSKWEWQSLKWAS